MERSSEPRPSRYLIYALVNVDQSEIFYIGKTHKRREVRLSEHMEAAANGSQQPVHCALRELIAKNSPVASIILERVPGTSDWKEAERRHIAFWRNVRPIDLPILYPPMSRLSKATRIERVSLTNVGPGG